MKRTIIYDYILSFINLKASAALKPDDEPLNFAKALIASALLGNGKLLTSDW